LAVTGSLLAEIRAWKNRDSAAVGIRAKVEKSFDQSLDPTSPERTLNRFITIGNMADPSSRGLE
jgi:hypothetical protein